MDSVSSEPSHILWFEYRGRYVSVEYIDHVFQGEDGSSTYRKRTFREVSGDKRDAPIVRHLNQLENDLAVVGRLKRLNHNMTFCDACFRHLRTVIAVNARVTCSRCHIKLPYFSMFRKQCIACSTPLCRKCYQYSKDNLFLYKGLLSIYKTTPTASPHPPVESASHHSPVLE